MRSRQRAFLRYAISVILTVILLYVAFRGTDPELLLKAMGNADYFWLIMMFALLMASHVVRSFRWRYLLNPIKPGIGFRNLFSSVMIGYFVNNLIPRAGEVARPYTLGKLEGISKSAAFGTIVVERLLDIACLLLLLTAIPLVYDGPLLTVFPWLPNAGMIMGIATLCVLGFLILLVVRRGIATGLFRRMEKIAPKRLREQFHRVGHSFLDGFLFITRPGTVLLVLVLTAGVWVLYVSMLVAAFQGFPFGAALGWRSAMVLLAISSIGIMIPTPGSTGGYHVLTSQALVHLFGVSTDGALVYATLTHGMAYVGVTVIGLYFMLSDHIHVSDVVRGEVSSA